MASVIDRIAHRQCSPKSFDSHTPPRASSKTGNLVLKRTVDLAFATAALIVLSPLMLAIATVIWIADGRSVIIAHRRIGRNGRPFLCLKFRTMVHDADEVLERHLQQDPRARREWIDQQKLTRDPRVTWLGHFLRATSLDELPQLVNVLKGEMSLVGPRPIVEGEIVRYGDRFAHCFSIAPGITGLWQITGRSSCSYDERVALDASYVARRTAMLDLAIMAKTIPAVISRRGM